MDQNQRILRSIRRIVRSVLRRGEGSSSVAELILALAEQRTIPRSDRDSTSWRDLVEQVSEDVIRIIVRTDADCQNNGRQQQTANLLMLDTIHGTSVS